MWNTVLTILTTVAPILLSLIGILAHFFVFHRLKCTKDLTECLKEHFPDYFKKENSFDVRLKSIENFVSELQKFIEQNKENK